MMRAHQWWRCVLVVTSCIVAVRPLRVEAQLRTDRTTSIRVSVNDDAERYLRALQVSGLVRPMSWTIRGFSPSEIARLLPADTMHVWRERITASPVGDETRRFAFDVLTPRASVFYNTAFPFGYNDGPVWSGRGATTMVSGGVAMRAGPLTAVFEPVAFRAENSAFELAPNGLEGRLVFSDARGSGIDLPQRFGDGAYQRIDPGQSTIRLDFAGVTLGASTANQHWGPAIEHPILLGNNAAGFAHLFAGTARPIDLWLFRAHGRLVWGRLEQSEFAVLEGRQARRFMSGIVGTLSPRGVPGLEIGAARFFHTLWPDSGLTKDDFLRPLSGLTQASRAGQTGGSGIEPDNQLASIFFRWVWPSSGFEVYGEYGRDDRNFDMRDLVLEPDHIAAYTLGLQKVWRRRSDRMTAVRAEVLNSRITHLQLARPQAPFYVHGTAVQGHTERGQILGSAGAYGGGAAMIAVDRWSREIGWTAKWTRLVRSERQLSAASLPQPDSTDVIHAFGVEATWLRRRVDVTGGVTIVHELNRDFVRDATNVNLSLGARAHW